MNPERRWFFMRMTLARQLTALALGTSTATLVLAAAVILLYDSTSTRQRLVGQTGVPADGLALSSAAAMAFSDAPAASDTLASAAADIHVRTASLYTPQGQLLARYARQPDGSVVDGLSYDPATLGASPSRFVPGGLVVIRPVMHDGQSIGWLVVVVDDGELGERAQTFGGIIAGVTVASIILAALLAVLLQRFTSGPLLQLTETARQVTDTPPATTCGPPGEASLKSAN